MSITNHYAFHLGTTTEEAHPLDQLNAIYTGFFTKKGNKLSTVQIDGGMTDLNITAHHLASYVELYNDHFHKDHDSNVLVLLYGNLANQIEFSGIYGEGTSKLAGYVRCLYETLVVESDTYDSFVGLPPLMVDYINSLLTTAASLDNDKIEVISDHVSLPLSPTTKFQNLFKGKYSEYPSDILPIIYDEPYLEVLLQEKFDKEGYEG